MTTKKLTNEAEKYLCHRGCSAVLKNSIYWEDPQFESDAIGFRGYDQLIIEIEVKISKSDFLADFRKDDRHRRIRDELGPNEFYFAVPPEMAAYAKERIPDYCGLLTIYGRSLLLNTVVKAPRIHNDKMDPARWQDISEKLYAKM